MGIVETSLPAGAGMLIASYYRKVRTGLTAPNDLFADQ